MTKTADPVSTYFSNLVNASPKTQDEIAREAGFQSSNTISMIKSGKTKLPIARIPALARALNADPRKLFALALQHYHPDIFSIYSKLAPEMLISDKEFELVKSIRKATGMSILT